MVELQLRSINDNEVFFGLTISKSDYDILKELFNDGIPLSKIDLMTGVRENQVTHLLRLTIQDLINKNKK